MRRWWRRRRLLFPIEACRAVVVEGEEGRKAVRVEGGLERCGEGEGRCSEGMSSEQGRRRRRRVMLVVVR